MSGLDILRSFAESREHDAVMIRDGINYGNVRDVQRLIAELERQLAAERERREAAEVILREMAKLYAGQIDNTGNYCNQLHDSARAHFARYAKD